MNYRQIIAESWKYTQSNKSLIIWFGFVSCLLTTTVGIGYIAYQFFALKNSYLFSKEEHSFLSQVVTFIMDFIKTHLTLTVPLVVFAVIFAIMYFLYPTLAKAGAIQTIARNRNGQKAGVGKGLRHGMMSFLPLLEYHILIKTFGFFSILIEMSFVLRNLGPVIFKILLPLFILLIIIGFILTLLFTYADFYIVIDNEPVFQAMKKSAKQVIMHWKHTFLITILMILIGVRIVIQVVIVFLIPALIVLITGYLATVTLPVTGVIVGGIVGLVALILAAYLNGIVEIFSYTVWTFTFLDITQEKEVSAREVVKEAVGEEIIHPLHNNLGP
ncbi:hypothetical protein HZA40_05110 [Candidatus Peregrinibacteria bacterium]|nr:hypothetical protein [Candidatus Peregrinibacteria bacterium]